MSVDKRRFHGSVGVVEWFHNLCALWFDILRSIIQWVTQESTNRLQIHSIVTFFIQSRTFYINHSPGQSGLIFISALLMGASGTLPQLSHHIPFYHYWQRTWWPYWSLGYFKLISVQRWRLMLYMWCRRETRPFDLPTNDTALTTLRWRYIYHRATRRNQHIPPPP